MLPTGDDDGDGFADNPGPLVPPTTVEGKQGTTIRSLRFASAPFSPNLFVSIVDWRVDLTGSWQFTIRNEDDVVVVFSPTIGLVEKMPFVVDMTLTGSGTTPTFHWTVPTIPAGLTHDRSRILIWDLEDRRPTTGVARRLFSRRFSPTETSFTVPVSANLEPTKASVMI